MRNLGFIFEYDGSDFSGWQYQPHRRTVHREVRAALSKILQEEIVIHCSGRTDAGVHARYQPAHAKTKNPIALDKLRGGLDSLLPADISLLAVSEMDAEFHARHSAESKTYSYHILNRRQRSALNRLRALHVIPPLDTKAMQTAADTLIGTHDFASFEGRLSEVKTTVRTIFKAEIKRHGDDVTFTISGSGFLKYMVRNITGTLVEIGLGKRPPAGMAAIVARQDRRAAGATAPPQGLFLERVVYAEPFESQLRAGLRFRGEKNALG